MSTVTRVLFLALFTVVVYFAVVRPLISLAPWVPTNRRDFVRVNELSDLKSGENFLEAGCGDARVAEHIARANPEVGVVAIELSVFMFLWAKLRAWKAGLPNLTIKFGNALGEDFSKFDVVYSYALTKTVNQKLMPKIKSELKPGARFISYAFKIKDKNTETDRSETSSNIHVYKQL